MKGGLLYEGGDIPHLARPQGKHEGWSGGRGVREHGDQRETLLWFSWEGKTG